MPVNPARLSLLVLSAVLTIALAACGTSATSTPILPTRGPLPTLISVPWRVAGAPIDTSNVGSLAQIGSLVGHNGTVNYLNFSHDNKLLLTVDGASVAIVWNLENGQIVSRPGQGKSTLFSFFSADAKTIVSVIGDQKVYFFNTQDGQEISNAPANSGGVLLAAISPDGKTLATGGAKGDVMLWDVDGHTVTRLLPPGTSERVEAMDFSPDSASLAVSIHGASATIWKVATGASIATLKDVVFVQNLQYSRNGAYLAAATDTEVRIYDTGSYTTRYLYSQPDLVPSRSMALSPDGRFFAATSRGDFVYIWLLEKSKNAAGLPQHNGHGSSVSFSPNNQFVLTTIVTARAGARLWDIKSINPDQNLYVRGSQLGLEGNGQYIGAWSPDGRMIILADTSGGMTVWGIPKPS